MIKTITELSKNIWEPVTSINSIKSQSPSTGDVYHDINKSKTYVFNGSNWIELRVTGKNAHFNRERMRKIKNIFNEK
jgi:hypothetical protein